MKKVLVSMVKTTHRMALLEIEKDGDVEKYLAKHGDSAIPLSKDDGVRQNTHEVISVNNQQVNIPLLGKITKDYELELVEEKKKLEAVPAED